MTSTLSYASIALLIGLTALGYAVATLGMKLATGGLNLIAFGLVILGLAAAVVAEIVLLRGANLAIIYLAIIASETVLVLIFAAFLGDKLNPQQLAGAAFVLGGMALVLR